MAPTKKTTTTTPTLREHFTEDPGLATRVRGKMIMGLASSAIEAVYSSGYRIDERDLFAPYTMALDTLTDEAERREWSRAHAPELREESKALARIRALEASGYNAGSRAAELAASREDRERAAREQAARIESTTAQILAQQEADRLAAAQAMATAMARK